jgi:hypothetical protein
MNFITIPRISVIFYNPIVLVGYTVVRYVSKSPSSLFTTSTSVNLDIKKKLISFPPEGICSIRRIFCGNLKFESGCQQHCMYVATVFQ